MKKNPPPTKKSETTIPVKAAGVFISERKRFSYKIHQKTIPIAIDKTFISDVELAP